MIGTSEVNPMKTLQVPDEGTDLTVDDLADLPRIDGYDVELDHGRLRIVAAAAVRNWHSEMQFRIMLWFRGQGRVAFTESGVILDDGTTRTPDVGVMWKRPVTANRAYHAARAYAVVVEVISPHSMDEDRFEKPRLYAAAKIPEYWLVEPDPEDEWDASVAMYKLEPTGYVLARTVKWSEFEEQASDA
jgi:Uma2 family endonuclease